MTTRSFVWAVAGCVSALVVAGWAGYTGVAALHAGRLLYGFVVTIAAVIITVSNTVQFIRRTKLFIEARRRGGSRGRLV